MATNHNLPQTLTTFVGRKHEMRELAALLNNPDCRLLTLAGFGGVGKTRLAVELAHNQLNEFPDGIYFVHLQPLQAADQVVSAITDTLRLKANNEQQLIASLHDKRLLLIMDNFEHVLDAAKLINQLLIKAPKLKILATSRTILNLQGEWIRYIDGLNYPNNNNPNLELDNSALHLFAERAKRLNSNFSLEFEYEYVLRICQYVGGIPLALELAAGWADTLTPREIMKEIGRDLSILTSDKHNVSDRHKNMWTVLNQSWHRLDTTEQSVFSKLCIFRGGFEREAARSVAGASTFILGNLVRKSWLRMNNGRYDIQEVLRQYGADHLTASGDNIATQQAHCLYYANFLQQLEPHIKNQNQKKSYQKIVCDFNNIRLAWFWAIKQKDFDIISQILECLYRFCLNHNYFYSFIQMSEAALTQLVLQPLDQRHRAWGQINARVVLMTADTTLKSDIEHGLNHAYQREDTAEIAHCLWALGFTAYLLNEHTEALTLLENCLVYYHQLEDPYYIAHALLWIGNCQRELKNAEAFYSYMNQSLEISQAIGDKVGQAWCLVYLIDHEFSQGHYGIALQMADEAFQLQYEMGNIGGMIMAFTRQGLIHLLLGNVEQAKLFTDLPSKDSIKTVGEDGYTQVEIAKYCRTVHALITILYNDYDHSKEILQQAYNAKPHIVDLRDEFINHFNIWGLAIAYSTSGDFVIAKKYLFILCHELTSITRETFLLLILPVLALILTHEERHKNAVELLGLAFSHPKSVTGWMKKCPAFTQLQGHLESQLGHEPYTSAWEHGAHLELETVISHFLLENEVLQKNPNQTLDEPLTARELEVLQLVAQGLSNREIAETLILSIGTVKGYVHNICQKLYVENRTHAVARAREYLLL